MPQVFVDTGGFYAALNRKDQYHREATVLFARAVEEAWQQFTSNFVVAETHALILTRLEGPCLAATPFASLGA